MSKQIVTKLALVVIGVLILGACGGKNTPANAPANTPAAQTVTQPSTQTSAQASNAPATGSADTDTDGDGIPNDAEKVLGTDPTNPDTDGDGQNDLADAKPILANSPIQESSTTKGFTLDAIAVENNVDAAGVGVADHIEVKVSNTTQQEITNFDVYYTFTDAVTGERQAYYRPLTGNNLQPAESKSLHLDNSGAADHYRVNPNSIYFANANALHVEVTLHAASYAPQTIAVDKDPIGNETGGD